MESNSKSRYEITAPSILRFRAHLMNATVIRRMPERKEKKKGILVARVAHGQRNPDRIHGYQRFATVVGLLM